MPKSSSSHEKRGRKPNPYLPQHLSNTVDLGQKQPPVEETRSQRSMSAPPENRATQNTNTSCRVDHEQTPTAAASQHHVDEPAAMGKMFSRATPAREPTPTQQQQPQPQQQQQVPKVCYIPIQVEGRDEPMMPRNPNIQSSGSAEKIFGNERVSPGFPGHARQQPKDMYGSPNKPQMQQPSQQQYGGQYQQHPPQAQQQPSHTQHPQQHPHMQQQAPPTYQGQGQPYMKPQQQQQPHPQQQQQQQKPKQQQAHPTAPLSNDPLEKIKCVRNDVMELMSCVENFKGTRKDREYLYLDEMLTRNLIKLDNIETEGKENIRLARKEAIKCIQTCISNLEARAQAKEHEARAAAEAAAEQGNAPQPAETNSGLIQAEQQHAAQNQEPEKFKSHATLVIGGVSKPGAEVASDTAQVEEEKKVETQGASEPMDIDASQELTQNTSETTSAAASDAPAPVRATTDAPGAAAEQPNPSEAVVSGTEQPADSGNTTNPTPSQTAETQQSPTQK